MKQVGMTIRLDEQLRTEFIEQCRRESIPASVVLREFIKGFVGQKKHKQSVDYSLGEYFSEQVATGKMTLDEAIATEKQLLQDAEQAETDIINGNGIEATPQLFDDIRKGIYLR